MRYGRALVTALAAAAMLAAGCGDASPDPESVTLLTHDSFAMSDDVLREFTAATGIEVEILTGGDAGTTLNQAILTKDNPIADVLFGVDNTFLSRALDAELFAPYEAEGLDAVSPELVVDPQHRVTPIDFGDVCLNYDREVFSDSEAPDELAALTTPEYAGKLVVQDPATSSPGLAFLLATIATFPEGAAYDWRDFWNDLIDNDVLITAGWEEAYNGAFSGGSGAGDRPIVVSYASSPPAEVIFSDPRPATAPTGVVAASCFRQIEFAGVLAETGNEEAARQFVDFMLTTSFQEAMPLNMFVFPARRDAELPPEFIEFSDVPVNPIILSPEEIGERRDEWIEIWSDLVR